MPSLKSGRTGLAFSCPLRPVASQSSNATNSLSLSCETRLLSSPSYIHALALCRTQASPDLPADSRQNLTRHRCIREPRRSFREDSIHPLHPPVATPGTRQAGWRRQRSSGQTRRSPRRRWPWTRCTRARCPCTARARRHRPPERCQKNARPNCREGRSLVSFWASSLRACRSNRIVKRGWGLG